MNTIRFFSFLLLSTLCTVPCKTMEPTLKDNKAVKDTITLLQCISTAHEVHPSRRSFADKILARCTRFCVEHTNPQAAELQHLLDAPIIPTELPLNVAESAENAALTLKQQFAKISEFDLLQRQIGAEIEDQRRSEHMQLLQAFGGSQSDENEKPR